RSTSRTRRRWPAYPAPRGGLGQRQRLARSGCGSGIQQHHTTRVLTGRASGEVAEAVTVDVSDGQALTKLRVRPGRGLEPCTGGAQSGGRAEQDGNQALEPAIAGSSDRQVGRPVMVQV